MKKNKRNVRLKNSRGISKHEFKLGSEAAPYVVREQFNDFDYLDKLSPEEFAWLAEFTSNQATGFEVEPDIVGEETAEVLNSVENKRAAYRRKNTLQRNELYTHKNPQSLDYQTEGVMNEEMLSAQSVDSYISMLEEIEDNIDAYWRDKHKS